MTACPNCGQNNAVGEQFCSLCGEYLGWEATGAAAPAPARPAPAPSVPAPSAPTTARKPPAPPDGAPPVPEPTVAEPTVAEPTVAEPTVAAVASALTAAQRLADEHDRPDLGRHLAAARERLDGKLVAVAVVGEFKRGKSTLVNAVLQTDVCPVDADIVTAVPTLVRHGATATATALLQEGDDPQGGATVAESVAVDELATLVSEAADPHRRRRLRSVEVRLPHRLLRTGLCLVDTPGVGGLDSAHGAVTLNSLTRVGAMIFVTDASQELTAPEMAFLRQALERCPPAVCVVTKTDLYPQWQRIVDLDRAHLAAAGIDIPVIGISSFLRLRAWRDPAHNEESGFPALFGWLRTTVLEAAARTAVDAATRDLDFARQQLRVEVTAEQQVLQRPEDGERVVAQLDHDLERRRRVAASGATWQQVLSDRIEDLSADVKHDLQERMRALSREAESVIDSSDPKKTWPDIEIWLQRQVIRAATTNHDLLAGRAEQLAAEVADAFAMESQVPVSLGFTAPGKGLQDIGLSAPDIAASDGQRMVRMVFAGRTAVLLPEVILGVLGGHLLLLAALGPLSVVLGFGIGRKMLRDERQRQLVFRRQQAKIACRRYLDEAAFVVGKDCMDSLRRTRRELRDQFQGRALVLQASSERALRSAERAQQLDPAERASRGAELARRHDEIDRLGRSTSAAPDRAGA